SKLKRCQCIIITFGDSNAFITFREEVLAEQRSFIYITFATKVFTFKTNLVRNVLTFFIKTGKDSLDLSAWIDTYFVFINSRRVQTSAFKSCLRLGRKRTQASSGFLFWFDSSISVVEFDMIAVERETIFMIIVDC